MKVRNKMSLLHKISIARSVHRPVGIHFTDLFDDFIEFHGDRLYGDDPAIISGIGMIDGQAYTVIIQNKGVTIEDKQNNNYGMAQPEGYRKALRMMKQAEKFNRPIITIIDTPGAYPGIGAEERGQGEAIARNLFELSDLKVPIISFLLSEGGSGGALALGISDSLHMFENAYYSVISPEGFASIIYKDAKEVEKAVAIMEIFPDQLLKLKIIDSIILEPDSLSTKNLQLAFANMRRLIVKDYTTFSKMSTEKLIKSRNERFNKFGS